MNDFYTYYAIEFDYFAQSLHTNEFSWFLLPPIILFIAIPIFLPKHWISKIILLVIGAFLIEYLISYWFDIDGPMSNLLNNITDDYFDQLFIIWGLAFLIACVLRKISKLKYRGIGLVILAIIPIYLTHIHTVSHNKKPPNKACYGKTVEADLYGVKLQIPLTAQLSPTVIFHNKKTQLLTLSRARDFNRFCDYLKRSNNKLKLNKLTFDRNRIYGFGHSDRLTDIKLCEHYPKKDWLKGVCAPHLPPYSNWNKKLNPYNPSNRTERNYVRITSGRFINGPEHAMHQWKGEYKQSTYEKFVELNENGSFQEKNTRILTSNNLTVTILDYEPSKHLVAYFMTNPQILADKDGQPISVYCAKWTSGRGGCSARYFWKGGLFIDLSIDEFFDGKSIDEISKHIEQQLISTSVMLDDWFYGIER